MRLFLLQAGVSLSLLLTLVWFLDAGEVVSRLGQMRAGWVWLAVALSVLQFAVSAWRWRFTAGRLGIHLPFVEALREYYLSAFLNQILPGGVLGDLSRAWRHARAQAHAQAAAGPAVRAVVLERASGQVVMTAVAVVSFLSLPIALDTGSRLALLGGTIALAVAVRSLFIRVRSSRPSLKSLVGRIWHDTYAALLSADALPRQIASSVVVVGSYVATYLVAARAVGVDTPLFTLLPLVAPVLVTMLVPMTVAGWGIREGSAAVLWGAVGLTVVDGVAISVAYGLLVLLCSVPGGFILVCVLHRASRVGPDRRGYPHQDGSDGTVGAAPGRATQSDPT